MERTNTPHQLNIEQTISQAWTLTKKHFPIFLLLTILMNGVSSLPQSVYYTDYMNTILENGSVMTEEEWLAMAEPATLITTCIYTILAGIACWLIQIYLNIVQYRLGYDATQGCKPDLTTRLKDGLRGYGFILLVMLAYTLLVSFGMIFCLLPGIYLAIRLLFTPLIAALHPERTFSECFSQSWEMTKGHFWTLFLIGITIVLLNILGFMCCCVGVLVTSIITNFMYIIVYRTLSDDKEDVSEDFTSENLTVVSE